jgi:hypothetical protein
MQNYLFYIRSIAPFMLFNMNMFENVINDDTVY